MLARVFVALGLLCASSLGQEAAGAAEAEAAAAPQAPQQAQQQVACPVQGGGFDDRYAVAQLLILQRNLAQAEVCLMEAVQSTLGAMSLLSDISAAQALPNRAAAFSSVLSQLNPNDGEVLFLHAQRLGQAGRWEEAKPLLQRLRGANPANGAIANTLGAAYYQTFDYEAAKAEFSAALEIMPNNTDFKANLNKTIAVASGAEQHDSPIAEDEAAAAAAAPEAA